ncbi:adaptor protein MecA [Streptococcus acidominimus]|uniref:Adapter protein MecA n=1 Tax=Streptococcus acidominimus TaxID=1326 RepID=A0A1Q8EEQ8_STRAI|nr:adaptor protein MecA [Streptococcus acidominimus]OLF50266.1 adaptor protein MecA [Streptococcus acidominimus]SUN06782.1 adaptor protein [Streptococcus acidominimus]
MKMKQISDSTLKITIKIEDLEERGMEIADFLVPQEKTEEFFYTVLDELDLPVTFRESGMLSFRVTPKPDKVDIFVTKSEIDQHVNFDDFTDMADFDELSQMTPDEFLKTLEKTIREKSAGDDKAIQHLEEVEADEVEEVDRVERQYIYYILNFASLQEAVQFVSLVDFTIEESELYKMDGRYYMTVLINIENRSTCYPDYILSRMLEHADDASISRAVLQEHGVLLIPVGAVDELGKVSLV